ncbi:MAG: hypothetical protein ACYSWZ_10465 [Planctomycetota bacterium]|jgi:hypothetical protein
MKKSTAIIFMAFLTSCATRYEWNADPSQDTLFMDELHSGERFRILADFNDDGIQDMALSFDISLFGNAGGLFTLYLGNAQGQYRKHGDFGAHPMAVSLEKIDTKVRLWTYERGGGWIGQIGYYEVLKDKLSEYHSITIHPGDSGTEMGNAIYEAVFKNSDLPITVERSVTKEGIVKWIDPNKAIDSDKK